MMKAIYSMVLVGMVVACGAPKRKELPADAAIQPDAKTCVGLECQVTNCGADRPPTTLSGTVYAPNGTLPLYNVTVYVPNVVPDPLPVGVTCDRCGTPLSGSPIAQAQSDYKGKFQLMNPPSGNQIPIVVQIGKWRRVATIPAVIPCQDNPIPAELTRLPRNQTEGNMPRIAVTLGGCDKIACLLPKVGIAPSEFGVAGDNKAVTFYSTPDATSGPAGMTSATSFWSDTTELAKYDMVILSCECKEASPARPPESKNAASFAAMTEYLAMGGRIFSTDYQYTWYKYSPDPALASIGSIPGGAPSGPSPIMIDATFAKGKALADWMDYNMLSAGYGNVTASSIFDNFTSLDPAKATTFGSSGGHPRFMTINTPVGAPLDQQCGKAVHLDAHINGNDQIDGTFPAGCTSPISSGEAAFAYFFFDLANCITNDGEIQ
jgi:hypothetical protein